MRSKEEIKEVLAVEKETWSDGNQTDMVIKGWIEALEYVLGGNDLVELIDNLEKSISENSLDVWMHDLSDTVNASFFDLTKYRWEDGLVFEYDGFRKEFNSLKKAIKGEEK